VSNRAAACIGCGAPLTPIPGFNLVPNRSRTPPPTGKQIKLRASLALLTVVLGVIWAVSLDHRRGSTRFAATMAALLLIGGLCWLIVTVLQSVASRK